MKKLFYTLILSIFALNLCAETYVTYYALNKADFGTIELQTEEKCTKINTALYNVYVIEHEGEVAYRLIENGDIFLEDYLPAENATYIDANPETTTFYDFYIVTDYSGNISDKITKSNSLIYEFELHSVDAKYKYYKNKFNSIFAGNRIIKSGKTPLGVTISNNNTVIYYDQTTDKLTTVEDKKYTDPSTLTSSIYKRLTYETTYNDIENWQWVSSPYDAELQIKVGTQDAIYSDANDDGTNPAFILMQYNNNKSNPWVSNGSAKLEKGVGYILGIDNRGVNGNVVANIKATNVINKIDNQYKRTLSTNNGGTADPSDDNVHLIGSGLFSAPTGCKLDSRFVHFAIPTTTGYTYIYATSYTSELKAITPHSAFFAQTAGDLTFDKSGSITQSAPSLKRAIAEEIVVEEYTISLAGADFNATTTILTDELGSEGYTQGEDFLYFHSSPNGDVANQLYSFDGKRTLAFNHRANSTQTILLGGVVAQDGRYTISLEGFNTNATSVILTDLAENTIVDLLTENYTFDANSGSIDDRFTVTINYAPNTTVNNDVVTNSNGIVVMNSADGCSIDNLIVGEQVMIFDATGRMVYNSQAQQSSMNITLNAGTYIVRQANNWAKFVIR